MSDRSGAPPSWGELMNLEVFAYSTILKKLFCCDPLICELLAGMLFYQSRMNELDFFFPNEVGKLFSPRNLNLQCDIAQGGS